MKLKIIVAMCENNGIGYKNQLPWKFNSDMKYFSTITKGNKNNAIIMGRNTHESIGKLLIDRYNIILSKSITNPIENASVFNNIPDALTFCKEQNFNEVWIIGGETIYKEFLKLNIVEEVYITHILKKYTCDSFFPELSKDFQLLDCFRKTQVDTMDLNSNNAPTVLIFKKYIKVKQS